MRGGAALHDDEIRGRAYDPRVARRLARYVRPYRGSLLLSLALLSGVSAAQLVQPYLIKLAIDGPVQRGEPGGLGPYAAAFLAALVVEFLLRYAQLWMLERVGGQVVLDLRNAAFAHLQRLDASYFDRHPVGRLMTRVTSDVEAIHEAFTSGLVLILADSLKLAAIVVILFWMDWRMALITLAVVPPLVVVTRAFGRRVRGAYREVRGAVARLNAFLQESLSGMRIVQLFARERDAAERFREINRDHREAQLEGVRYDSLFSALAELFGSLTLAAIVWVAASRILAGAVSFGTLVAFIDYAGKFFRPLQDLSQRYTTMQAAMASAERIFRLLDTGPAIVTPAVPCRAVTRLAGTIVFDRVTFGYEPGLPVLHDVSFEIAAGERVGLVGWTGSGKSTLIRLLVRLYDVWEGRVLLDGIDVRERDLRELRRSVGVVLQEPFLFAGTVEENISLGDPALDAAAVSRAAEAVHADAFVRELAGGYAAEVRERGSNLSVGQKQLLAFARAMARDPSVLVLDEATASVDVETERRIQGALQRILAGRTALIVAHRLVTVRDADRILVLHHGRLAEQGSHDALLRLEGGIYRTLCQLQTV